MRNDYEIIAPPRNGNYLGIIELIAKFNNFLAQHIQNHANRGSGYTNYLSSTIMEELVDVMGRKVIAEIIHRVKQSLDSTADESHVDQLTLVLQYMESNGPVERFMTFMANKGHKAQDMFDSLKEFLLTNNLSLSDCRGQSYDNASAMSGRYNGLQSKVDISNHAFIYDTFFDKASLFFLFRSFKRTLEPYGYPAQHILLTWF